MPEAIIFKRVLILCCSYLESLPWETQHRCRPSPQSPLAPLPVSFPTIPFAVIAAAAPSPPPLERAPLYWKIYEGGGQKRGGEGREGGRQGGREGGAGCRDGGD